MIKSREHLTEADFAQAPYSLPKSSLFTVIQQYQILLRMLLCSYRSTWFLHIFMGLLLPITLAFTMRLALEDMTTERAVYMLGGSIAMSIIFGPTQFLISRIGWSRQNREFEYWIALPVPKLNLILALLSVALLFALPGVIGSYLLGSYIFGVPLGGSWAFLVLIPLGTLSMAGIGAFLGSIAPSGQVASLIANLMVIFLGLLSPLLIPLEALPGPLQFLSLFVPITYAADAFRAALVGRTDISFYFDVIILAIISLVFLAFVHWKLEWRAK